MNICLIGSMRNLARMQRLSGDLKSRGHAVHLPVDLSEENFTDRLQEKAEFMRKMYDEINECDTILVVNDEQRLAYTGYIGPNTFLQLGMGFALGKQLFCLQDWDKKLTYDEELRAMNIQKLDIQVRF
jgi:nucleoside 2-deoxyribosyltransferase